MPADSQQTSDLRRIHWPVVEEAPTALIAWRGGIQKDRPRWEQVYVAPDVDLIRRACFDPGKFVEREFTDHGDEGWPQGKEYEPLHVWQARAVAAALTGERS